MNTLTEAEVEEAALSWLGGLGWDVAHGPDISHDGDFPERASYEDVITSSAKRRFVRKTDNAI